MKKLFVGLSVLGLVLASCTSSQDEGGSTTSTAVSLTTTTAVDAATTTTLGEAPSKTETESRTSLTSVVVVQGAGAGGVVVPEDGLPFLVVDADGRVSTVKCLDEACTDYEFGASFSSRRGYLLDAPHLLVGDDGFPMFVFADLDSEEGETARFEERLPPDNRIHLVRCLDEGCTEFTDTDLGAGFAHSLEIVNDGGPLISYAPYGESWDDLRDWYRAEVLSCADRQCTERISAWVGGLQDAWTHAFVDRDGLPVIAYGLLSGDEIGAVFCDDTDCVSHERVTVATDKAGTVLVGAAMSEEGPVFAYTAGPQLTVVACLDDRCSEVGTPVPVGEGMAYGPVRVVWRADGAPVFAVTDQAGSELDIATCSDADCESASVVRLADESFLEFNLTVDTDDNPVILRDGVVIRCVDPQCRLGSKPSSLWDTSDQIDRVLPPVMEDWHLAGVLGDRGGGSLDVVIEGGPGVVAFGQDCGLDAAGVPGCESKVWVSGDGQDWAEAGTLGKAQVWAAEVNGSKILAGGDRTFTDGIDTIAPALWLSTDGHDWTLVSTDENLFRGCTESDPVACGGTVEAIVPVDDGFWAMGSNASGPVSWFSGDGTNWEASGYPLDAFDESSLTAGTFMNWAVPGGDGIVAIGYTCESGPISRPVCGLLAVTSVDGSTWRPLDPPFRSAGDLDFFEPETWSGGHVAVAQLCDLRDECILSMATSADAVNWTVESIEDPFAPVYLETLYGFGGGVVGIGGLTNGSTGMADPVFIHTNDMTTWTMESADPELFRPDRHAIIDAIQFGDRFIAVGMTTEGPTVWWYDG